MTKLAFCLLALFLSLASCETAFRPTETPPELPSEDFHKDIAQFFEGLFSHFDLEKPKQIIFECFCEKTAALYIDALYNFGQVLKDMDARETRQVHLDFIKMYWIAIQEHPTSNCIVQTQDFSDLVAALGIKRDPLLDNIGNWLYYQADYSHMLDDYYSQVLQNLDAKNFTAAGDAYGIGLKNVVDAVKGQGFYYLAHQGLSNGFALGLDIDLPSDSLTVWNDTTAAYDLEFMIEATRAVAEGKWWESYENLVKFWKEKGEDILGHIPLSVWECLQGSDDNKKITDKLGVDMMSKEYEDLALAWIKKHQWKYHAHAKLLLKNFEQLNVLHAGSLHAALVSEIVKSK